MNPIKSAIFRNSPKQSNKKSSKEGGAEEKHASPFRNPFRSSEGSPSKLSSGNHASANVPPVSADPAKDDEGGHEDVFFDDSSGGEMEQPEEGVDYETLNKFKEAVPQGLDSSALAKRDLHEAVAALPFGNAEELFYALRDLFKLSHLYHADWAALSVDSHLIHQVVDSIRRYEANGLQLNGDGVRLLYKVVSCGSGGKTSSANSSSSEPKDAIATLCPVGIQVLSEHAVIELLLRLALEHTVRDVCIALMESVVQQDASIFTKICDICVSIVDELPVPLNANNFFSFMVFIVHFLSKHPSAANASHALKALAALVPQVETNHKVYSFQTMLSEFLLKTQKQEAFSLDKASTAALYQLLTGLTVVCDSFVSRFLERGVVGLAAEAATALGESASKWDGDDEKVYISVMGFLSSCLLRGDVSVFHYLRGIDDDAIASSKRQLVRLRSASALPVLACATAHPAAVEAGVTCMSLLYGSTFVSVIQGIAFDFSGMRIDPASCMPVLPQGTACTAADAAPSAHLAFDHEDSAEFIRFVEVVFSTILLLLEQYSAESVSNACESVVCVVGECASIFLQPFPVPKGGSDAWMSGSHAATAPAALSVEASYAVVIGVIQAKAAACRALLVEFLLDDLDNFDIENAVVVDAISALSGSRFNCWDPAASTLPHSDMAVPTTGRDVPVSPLRSVSHDLRVHNSPSRMNERASMSNITSIDMLPSSLRPATFSADDIPDPDIVKMIAQDCADNIPVFKMSPAASDADADSHSGDDHRVDEKDMDIQIDIDEPPNSDLRSSRKINALDELQDVISGLDHALIDTATEDDSEGRPIQKSNSLQDLVARASQTAMVASQRRKSLSPAAPTRDSDDLAKALPLERSVSDLIKESCSRTLVEAVEQRQSMFDDWEMDSTETICRNVLLLIAASKSVGMDWLLSIFPRQTMLDVVTELIMDERHGLNTYPLMEEKFIQFFASIIAATSKDPSDLCIAVYDRIVAILSEWENLKMTRCVESYVNALVVLANYNKNVQRRVLNGFEKIYIASERLGYRRLLEPLIALLSASVDHFHRLDASADPIVVHWTVFALRREAFRKCSCVLPHRIHTSQVGCMSGLTSRICLFITKMGGMHPQAVFRLCSRREIEKPIISILCDVISSKIGDVAVMRSVQATSSDPVVPPQLDPQSCDDLILLLRTCLTLARDLNIRPMWVPEPWCYHWSIRERTILSHKFSSLIINLWMCYKECGDVELKSLCIGILVDIAIKIAHSPVKSKGGKGKAKVNSTKAARLSAPVRLDLCAPIVPETELLPILALSLKEFTAEMQRRRSTMTDGDAEGAVARNETAPAAASTEDASSGMHAGESAKMYAIHSEAVLHTLDGIRLYLCDEETGTLRPQYAKYFDRPPVLCASVLYLMETYSSIALIQKVGMEIVLHLCTEQDAECLDVLGSACRCIISSIICYPSDQIIHQMFCTLVMRLAGSSEKNRNSIIFHSLYKWLFIPIKCAWHDVTPTACRAVSLIANTIERAQILGTSRICEVLISALGKLETVATVQIDGLRAALALAKSEVCIRKLKADGGKKVLSHTRRFVVKILGSDPPLIPEGYSRMELESLLYQANEQRQLFEKMNCLMS